MDSLTKHFHPEARKALYSVPINPTYEEMRHKQDYLVEINMSFNLANLTYYHIDDECLHYQLYQYTAWEGDHDGTDQGVLPTTTNLFVYLVKPIIKQKIPPGRMYVFINDKHIIGKKRQQLQKLINSINKM